MQVTIPNYIQNYNRLYEPRQQTRPSIAYPQQYQGLQTVFKSNYVPATSISEAKKFALKELGIKRYEINDLEVANWLNKALLYVKRVTNGKSTILDRVVYTNFTDPQCNSEGIMATYQSMTYTNALSPIPHIVNDTLIINKNFVKNIDKFLSIGKSNLYNFNIITKTRNGFRLASNYTTKYKKEFERLLNENYRNLTFEDKMGLYDFLSSMQDYSEFKMADIDYYVDKFLKYNSSKIPNVYKTTLKLFTFDSYNKFALLNECEQIAGIVHDVNIDGKYKAILHEVGHMLHAHQSPLLFCYKNQQLERHFRKNLHLAAQISQYAKTSPNEFVAETFVKLALKIKLSSDIMALYKYCGGYIV